MCGPVAAALAFGGAETLNAIQQRQTVKATNAANREVGARNRREALRAMTDELRGVNARIAQERLSSSQVLQNLYRDAVEVTGTAQASNTTVEGNSVKALLDDYRRQELLQIRVTEDNLANIEDQAQRDKGAIVANTVTRINQGQPAIIPTPNLLAGAIQIGTSALQGYTAAGGFTPTKT